jgi:two-component system CheB/CheR fusion protein
MLAHLLKFSGASVEVAKKESLPVLALTGFGRPEDIERARATGFFSHVTKPFELEAVTEVLQNLPRVNPD